MPWIEELPTMLASQQGEERAAKIDKLPFRAGEECATRNSHRSLLKNNPAYSRKRLLH